jgi:arabinofuranan 3-O-arabinosyltransferase
MIDLMVPERGRPEPDRRSRLDPTRGGDKLRGLEDRVFTEERLRFYGIGVVIGLIITFILCWAWPLGQWLVNPDGKLGSIDFCWIWVSGKFAAFSDPSRIYDQAIYAAAQYVYYWPGECLFMHQYVYPPTFLFFTYLLGVMPYLLAFAVWVAATLVLYLAVVYAIIPYPAALIAAITSPAALKNAQLGHNGFLTAGLIGMSLVLLERRPWLSGICLGLLTCKPQFGVLFPLALLVSRNWRALAGAAASGLIISVTAAFAFGARTWPAFIASLFDRTAGLSPQAGVELWLESVYGLLHWAGAGARLAWTVHLTVAAAAAVTVCAVWVKPVPHPLKAAILCIGALLVSPYLLPYDLCILSIGAAFLIKDGLSRGFLAGERTIVLICLALLYCPLAPLGPVVYIVLLWLVLRRIVGVRGPKLSYLPPDRTAGFPRNFSETRTVPGD